MNNQEVITSPLFFMFAEMLIQNLIIGLGAFVVFVVTVILLTLFSPRTADESKPHEQQER